MKLMLLHFDMYFIFDFSYVKYQLFFGLKCFFVNHKLYISHL